MDDLCNLVVRHPARHEEKPVAARVGLPHGFDISSYPPFFFSNPPLHPSKIHNTLSKRTSFNNGLLTCLTLLGDCKATSTDPLKSL